MFDPISQITWAKVKRPLCLLLKVKRPLKNLDSPPKRYPPFSPDKAQIIVVINELKRTKK